MKLIGLVIMLIIFTACDTINLSLDSLPASKECIELIDGRIPNQLIVTQEKPLDAYKPSWKDGTPINNKQLDNRCFRKGSKEGENVNYQYFIADSHTCKSGLKYSKKIVEADGTVKGDVTFVVTPVLKLSDDQIIATVDGEPYKAQQPFSKLEYAGFTEKVKTLTGYDTITFRVTKHINEVLKKTFEDEEGEIDFVNPKFEDDPMISNYAYISGTYQLYIIPDFLRFAIYDVVDYQIVECNTV